jgi:DNA-binding PadR family transcriptional regulator
MSYLADNPRDKTMLGIESVVEWIEARQRPFTTHEAFHGAQLNADQRWEYPDPSFSTTYRTIRELERHGLVVRVTKRGAKPARWIAIDHQEEL